MSQVLLVSIRFHDGRYHGTGDWPPAPARLFQALIAGSAHGEQLTTDHRDALEWLEKLDPPHIVAPRARAGQGLTNYVPNNALDSVGGDVRRIGEIRTTKLVKPRLFDPEIPFLYIWRFDSRLEENRFAQIICSMADGIYQLGRGVDMSWATGEILEEHELDSLLTHCLGSLYRPSNGGGGEALECPRHGSLASLKERFERQGRRFAVTVDGKKVRVTFTQAPKPRFISVSYGSPPARWLYDLKSTETRSPFAAWPLESVAQFVQIVRGSDGHEGERLTGAVKRLTEALPAQAELVKRILVGRDAGEADKAARVRIVPLPSIGHEHTDPSIRRVMVEVPPDCPIAAEDIAWAFSGLEVEEEQVDQETGEILGNGSRLVRGEARGMLAHYGIDVDERFQVWRTVTPVALPGHVAHRGIDPRRLREGAKNGAERMAEHARAATAVLQALRHVGIRTQATTVRVQREPFGAKGARADAFADGTRFAKERLWHVEIGFTEAVEGPLLIGDGRYMGLGLMAPVRRTEGASAFAITDGLVATADPIALAQALRRAVMARVQAVLGKRELLPAFFTGHAPNGVPLRPGNHGHLAFTADLKHNRLLIIAPYLLEGRHATGDEQQHLKVLQEAIEGLEDLRAGAAGRLKLARLSVHIEEDPLFAPANTWDSVTDYHPTRYAKRVSKTDALIADVRSEIVKRGIPNPVRIEVTTLHEGPRGGLAGRLRLQFATAVSGLILIGRTRHSGGGLFSASEQ